MAARFAQAFHRRPVVVDADRVAAAAPAPAPAA
jgi:hypothetical protein